MRRSAPTTAECEANLNALLLIGSILWLSAVRQVISSRSSCLICLRATALSGGATNGGRLGHL
jgi:hypothetical protein